MEVTHVVDVGATTTRCGIPLHRKGSNPYPYVGAAHVARHVKGRGMVVCPQCGHG